MNNAKRLLIAAALALICACVGCAPYAEIGFGHSLESGAYPTFEPGIEIDERGCINHTEVGLEFKGPWWTPHQLKLFHRSQCNRTPELVSNDIMLSWKVGGFNE